jgi:hypothetical protein
MLVLDTEKAIEVDAGLDSLNSKFDSRSSETPANGRHTAAPSFNAIAEEQTRPAQSSTGKAAKKAAAKKNGSALHLAKAGAV